MSVIDFVCVLVLGYVIGNLHTIWKLKELISSTAKEKGIRLDGADETKSTVHDIYKLEVEKVGDTLYLYDIETKDFVCQGSSLSELAMLSKTYRNIIVATVSHDDKVFMFVNGNYKELTQ
jgi:hypothetical protein